jgi:hypothetical protein
VVLLSASQFDLRVGYLFQFLERTFGFDCLVQSLLDLLPFLAFDEVQGGDDLRKSGRIKRCQAILGILPGRSPHSPPDRCPTHRC